MSFQIRVPRNETEVPLNLYLNDGGPVTGATAVVAIRDGDTDDSYLDFNDATFKTAGHTTRQAALAEGEVGVYTLSGGLDLSAITNLPAATDHLLAEFEVTAPASSQVIVPDIIHLDARIEDLNDLAQSDVLSDATPFAGGNVDAAVSSRATQAQILSDATPFAGANVDAAVSSRATQAQILSDATPFAGANVDAAVTSRLAPTVGGRTLDVTTGGEAGIDFNNINGTLDAVNVGADTLTAIEDAIWDALESDHTDANSYGIRWTLMRQLLANKITLTGSTLTVRNDTDTANLFTIDISAGGRELSVSPAP